MQEDTDMGDESDIVDNLIFSSSPVLNLIRLALTFRAYDSPTTVQFLNVALL